MDIIEERIISFFYENNQPQMKLISFIDIVQSFNLYDYISSEEE